MVGNVRKSVGNNRSKQKGIVLEQLTRCADHTKLLYSFWDLVSFLFSKRLDRSRHKIIFLGCDLDCYGLRDLLLSPGHEQDARMQSLCRDLSVEAALFLMIPQHLPAFRERINPGTRNFKKEKKEQLWAIRCWKQILMNGTFLILEYSIQTPWAPICYLKSLFCSWLAFSAFGTGSENGRVSYR